MLTVAISPAVRDAFESSSLSVAGNGWFARLLALLVVMACGSRAPEPPKDPIDAALERAGAFLAAKQSPDGGFSSKYASLRDGWSLAPLATLALRVTPAKDAYAKGVAYVARLVEGGRPREMPEVSYPLHAWAIGALVLSAPENLERHRSARDALLVAVRGHQLAAANGWKQEDASFGGWGYSPRVPKRPDGEVNDDLLTANLSATVLAIGALALAGAKPDDPALRDAAGFLERCRAADGGFFFSPAHAPSNKAGRDAGGFRAYGSMTADGLRAQLRLGKTLDERALAWLVKHFDPAANPGRFDAVDEIRRASSYYYWAWSAAHALEHTRRDDKRWAEALAAELLRRQRPDGSWVNDATEMREDDPVIATSFAIAALAICKGVVTGERVSHAGWK